ncbi:hypothetical protein [Vibrio mediterranei]|uniref:hypothetical protein n=1 Tax=Vibrio mediterranei TaxID=689 RepID=UPI00406887E4
MSYLHLAPSTLAHSRAILSIAAFQPTRNKVTIPKSDIGPLWTESKSARSFIHKACQELSSMKVIDRANGEEFTLAKSVTMGTYAITFRFTNRQLELIETIRELCFKHITTTEWAMCKSRYTLPLFLAFVTSGGLLSRHDWRTITGNESSYAGDGGFVKYVLKPVQVDLENMFKGGLNEQSRNMVCFTTNMVFPIEPYVKAIGRID